MKAISQRLVIVTPVFEDAEASARLFSELFNTFGSEVFVVAVDDGSVQAPLSIASLEAAGVSGVVLKLRRNVGHQRAIAIGLSHVAGRVRPDQLSVVMDSDGEDLPSSIAELVEALDRGQVDVVVARRKSRVETWRFKAFYAVYKRFFNVMTGRAISFGNFMVMNPMALKRLVSMQELSIHVAAATLASKLRTQAVAIARGPRYAGRSKMNFVGLALHGFKALMVFAEDVLVRVGIFCAVFAGLTVLAGVVALGLKLTGFATPGWFSVSLGILTLMFLQSGALALMALMTLMLTGVVRGGTVTTAVAYEGFVEQVIETRVAPS